MAKSVGTPDLSAQPSDPARRRFVTSAPLVAAGLAAEAASPSEAGAATDTPPPDDPRQPVYRETDHVRAYYARARG